MAIPADTRSVPDPDAADALDRLVRGRGLERHALFGVVGEGREMPSGLEEVSGYALASDGRVYFFWTGWDAERMAETLRIWEQATPDASWADDSEYVAAQKKLGLRTPV